MDAGFCNTNISQTRAYTKVQSEVGHCLLCDQKFLDSNEHPVRLLVHEDSGKTAVSGGDDL